jgi:hypothetical protein
MDRCPRAFNALPSELRTAILSHLDDVVDLQNLMLASSHIWRHLAHDKASLPIVDRLLKNDCTHPQVAFSIYAAAHLRHRTPQLDTYIRTYGLNFLQPGFGGPAYALAENPILTTLPREMTPLHVRSLLTTSSAVYATTLRCMGFYANRFQHIRILKEPKPINFDLHADALSDLFAGPRYAIDAIGRFTWGEVQRTLKAFWMVHFTRMFLDMFEDGALSLPDVLAAQVSKMKPIDLFAFERHGSRTAAGSLKRPHDYLFDALHLYLSAEEFLSDVKLSPQTHLTPESPPCQRTERDMEMWPEITETMDYFGRIFQDIRSQRDGDGFYPWRRLGFAIWDEKRLRAAGLMNESARDRELKRISSPDLKLEVAAYRASQRIRWLSIIREADYPIVQSHRLTVHESDREDDPNYEYPADSDESWSP